MSPNLFAGAIQHHQGRKTLDFVFHREIAILFPEIRALVLGSRKIDLNQNKILTGVLLEGRLRKNVVVKSHAIAAPIRTREIQEHELVAGFGFLLSLFEICLPPSFGAGGAGKRDAKNEQAGKKK